ncbi:hypothetical protein EPI10_015674 [Gossypium australe]|uniref:Uncharacterized protein n=1 Tax=Gossypium australe TaxID=47621 RepID=A0A5B6VLF6_9ROSI|nr:hypothetical protein EPI10_015674 [Gossypium australe]
MGVGWQIGIGDKVNIWNNSWIPGPGNERVQCQHVDVRFTIMIRVPGLKDELDPFLRSIRLRRFLLFHLLKRDLQILWCGAMKGRVNILPRVDTSCFLMKSYTIGDYIIRLCLA